MPTEFERISECIHDLRALVSEGVPYHTERVARVYRDMDETILQIFGEHSVEYQDYTAHRTQHGPANPQSNVIYPQSQFRAGLPLTIELLEYLRKRHDRDIVSEDELGGPNLKPPITSDPPAGLHFAQPTARRRHDVFVSYSASDSGFVDDVVRALELQGVRCWIAPRDITPGAPSWAVPIATAIADSRLVLVFLTVCSIGSDEVVREVHLAANKKIPMLGVKLDDAPLSPALEYYFVAAQRLDINRSMPAEQVQRIVPAVNRQLLAVT